MMPPPRDARSYAMEMLAGFPKSTLIKLWPTDLSGVWGKLLLGMAQEFARVNAKMRETLAEMDPRTTNNMLSDWETAYGLPDECTGPLVTIGDRRKRLVTLVTMIGSLTPKFLTAMAYNIGYDVLVEHKQPARMGMRRMGDTLRELPFAFHTRIHAPPVTVRRAHCGSSFSGDRLSAFGNDQLTCVMRRHLRATHLPRLVISFNDPQDTLGASLVWDAPGPASGVDTALPARAAGATYFLVGTFAAEAFGGSDAAFALIASSTRISVGAAAGGDAPRATVPIAAPVGQCLISIVHRDTGGERTVRVRINGADVDTVSVAGSGAQAGDMIAFTAGGLDLFGMKGWPIGDDELDWLERVLARQFNLKLAGWPVDLTQGV